MKSVLKQSFLCCPAISSDILATPQKLDRSIFNAGQEGRHRVYSADRTNLAGLQALLDHASASMRSIQFLQVLTFACCRGVLCVATGHK